MTHPDDDELRSRFHDLRDDDRGHIPSFGALWDRAEARARTSRHTHTPGLVWIAAAASIVLAVGVVLARSDDGDPTRLVADSAPLDAVAAQTIGTWTSPTAGLLRTPGRDLLVPPSIHSSILDGVTGTARQRNGDQR